MSTSNFVLVTGGADLGFIALAAVRYAMGRRTYAPSLVCDWVMQNIAALPLESVHGLQHDVADAVRREREGRGDLGDDCDVARWQDFLAQLDEHLLRRTR